MPWLRFVGAHLMMSWRFVRCLAGESRQLLGHPLRQCVVLLSLARDRGERSKLLILRDEVRGINNNYDWRSVEVKHSTPALES